MPTLRVVVAGTAVLVVVGLSACGGVERARDTDRVTVTVTETVRAEEEPERNRKKRHRAAATRSVACDANIMVRRDTTTCGFAQNVFYEYWLSGGDDVIEAYSPATETVFTTRCHETAVRVTCSTSDGGRVRFPVAAVAAYTSEQADAYAARADLGPGHGAGPEDEGPGDDGGEPECDPNYEGACLDPYSSDYDCAGGTGDGPDYTDRVSVVGDDHFDLDRDGDGVACDW